VTSSPWLVSSFPAVERVRSTPPFLWRGGVALEEFVLRVGGKRGLVLREQWYCGRCCVRQVPPLGSLSRGLSGEGQSSQGLSEESLFSCGRGGWPTGAHPLIGDPVPSSPFLCGGVPLSAVKRSTTG
jgi:hypothetical protein